MGPRRLASIRPLLELSNGKPRLPKQISETQRTATPEQRCRQHQNDCTGGVCVIRRKAEPGGNNGVPLEAIWAQYQQNGKKYVVRSPSQSKNIQNKDETET